jgi:protein-disulfide isomerase/uncharacterized membrane protein YphA (DoxX/SURF4 family)
VISGGAESALVKWNTLRPWLGTVIRLALGAIWIWAASSKLGSPRSFVQVVRAYDATPEWMSKAIGYGLPVLELCIGILLVLGLAVQMSAAVSGVLFLIFLIGLIQASARGIQLECGCFGGGGTTAGSTQYTLDILRDVGLLILASYLVVWPYTRVSVEEFLGRNDYVEPPSAKRMRSDKGQRKYNAMLEERRKAARTRALWLNASLGVVVILIGLIGIGVQSGRAKIAGSVTATHASVSQGVVFGKKAAATVDIYEDFQCPHCLDFEKTTGKTIDADVRANKAQVRFHPLAFLDSSSSGNRYSSRAANAALCASDISVDDFVAYHNILYGTYKGKQVQPAEGSNGRTNAELEAYASAIGIKGAQLTDFDTCVSTEKHKALVQAITDNASSHGVNATPTVKVNGKSISADLKSFNAAIAKALKNGPAPDPSKTPSPTPTPTPTSSGTGPAKTSSPPAKKPSTSSSSKG